MIRRLLVVLGLSVMAVGCLPATLVPAPTVLEARAFLNQAIADAQAGRFDALCAVGGGNCERILDEARRPAPQAAPRVVGTRIHQPTSSEHGGVVLEICGQFDSGDAYYTEMVVFRDNGQLRAIEPVYWSGYGIADDGNVGDKIGGDAAQRCA